MSRKVRLTQEAKTNITAISGYIADESPQNAQQWRARIRERFRSLGELSALHEIAYPATLVGFEVRRTYFGVYSILYTIAFNETVVLTIRHGARRPLTRDEIRRLK
jgi:plasmid stabilization system protein ParE